MKRLILALAVGSCAAHADAPPGTEVVILGEVHDNFHVHVLQAEALKALRPRAVVFEMLSPAEAALADADRRAIPEAWAASGWLEYALYAPIFDAVGDARIVGAADGRGTIRAILSQGPAAVFGADAARFGLDLELPEDEQAARERRQFEAHCRSLPRELMSGMVDVQRFRDARFAHAVLKALDAHGPPVALITGNGHARTDWGVPALIARAAPEVNAYAIAFAEARDDAPYDEIRIVPEAEREDPCAAFGSN